MQSLVYGSSGSSCLQPLQQGQQHSRPRPASHCTALARQLHSSPAQLPGPTQMRMHEQQLLQQLQQQHQSGQGRIILRSQKKREQMALPETATKTETVVRKVVSLVSGTDGGAAMSKRKRLLADGLLDKLEEVGAKQEPRPLENDLLWGNYNVVYTSTSRSQEKRTPSGGRFRGRLGRALFQTTGLYQSVIKPGIVTNKVAFKLFGLIPGSVGLRGKVQPVGSDGDTVKVDFEPPVLSFMENVNGGLHLRIGKESDVTLATTYLDERVRIGKGSRGSLFVFTRGGAADRQDMESVGRQQTAPSTVYTLASACIASLLGGLALFLSAVPVLQALSPLLLLLGAGLGVLLRAGSIIRGSSQEGAQQQELAAGDKKDQGQAAAPVTSEVQPAMVQPAV